MACACASIIMGQRRKRHAQSEKECFASLLVHITAPYRMCERTQVEAVENKWDFLFGFVIGIHIDKYNNWFVLPCSLGTARMRKLTS